MDKRIIIVLDKANSIKKTVNSVLARLKQPNAIVKMIYTYKDIVHYYTKSLDENGIYILFSHRIRYDVIAEFKCYSDIEIVITKCRNPVTCFNQDHSYKVLHQTAMYLEHSTTLYIMKKKECRRCGYFTTTYEPII